MLFSQKMDQKIGKSYISLYIVHWQVLGYRYELWSGHLPVPESYFKEFIMFSKILCAKDLNAGSSEAVKKAVQLAHQYNSQIIMLNVHEEFMTKEEMGMLRVSIDAMKLEIETIALKAKKEMSEVIKKLHAEDIQVEYIIKEGKSHQVICQEAERIQADLIIMGVSEKNIVSNFIFRSTASFVIEHVEIPVLVVPLKDK